MPIGYSPDERLDVQIEEFDGHLPKEQRVTFKCKPLTVSENRKLRSLLRDFDKAETADEQQAKITEAIMLGISGWSLGKPFNAESIDDEMTTEYKINLAIYYAQAIRLTEIEKKASRSRPTSAPENSNPASHEPTNK